MAPQGARAARLEEGHPWRLACLAFARPEVNVYGAIPLPVACPQFQMERLQCSVFRQEMQEVGSCSWLEEKGSTPPSGQGHGKPASTPTPQGGKPASTPTPHR